MKMTENIQNNPVKFLFLSCVIVYIRSWLYDFTNYALFEKYDWKVTII